MFKSIFSNSSGILVSRIFGLIRDMFMASTLGVSIYTDIFFVAFQLPNLFRRIFGEGAFSQAFIPSFVRSRKKILFSASIFLKLISAVGFLTVLVFIFDSEVTKMIATGFSDENIEKATIFVKINFLYLIAIFTVTFLSAILHYREHFATTSFSTALLNISMILALMIGNGMSDEKIVYLLSFAVVLGGILQVISHVFAILFLKLNRVAFGGFSKWKRFDEVADDSQNFFTKFSLAIWGGATAQISSFLDTLLASFLITGSISYLYFANRVFQFPLAIFGIAITMAIFPKVAKYLKDVSGESKAEEILKKAFWLLAYLLSSATLVGIVWSEEIVSLLFERGEFSEIDRIETAKVLTFYLFGLAIFGVAKLFSLWLYAKEKIGKSAKIATYSLFIKIVVALALLEDFGASGLAFSTTISSFALFIFTVHEFGWNRFRKILKSKLLFLLFPLLGIFYFLNVAIKLNL
ncbi:integral membrane protein MviN [Thiovulum sp. ES]|nr:integral membrane protein MviN [Thiovulum sp. ES]